MEQFASSMKSLKKLTVNVVEPIYDRIDFGNDRKKNRLIKWLLSKNREGDAWGRYTVHGLLMWAHISRYYIGPSSESTFAMISSLKNIKSKFKKWGEDVNEHI